MNIIQDEDFVLHKAMAEFIKKNIQQPLRIANDKCHRLAADYERTKKSFMEGETFDEVGKNSKLLEKKREKLLDSLVVQDRLEKIYQRNEARLKFINSHLEQVGIYNFAVEKKKLQQAIGLKDAVSEQDLNLNAGESGVTYKFFNGEILAFKNDELDLSQDYNIEVLKTADSKFYHELVSTFPESVGTIPDECFMASNIKNNILIESILFVASKMKTQTIKQSNAQLGGMLANAGRINGIEEYAEALKNYLNVIVKQCMRKNLPQMEQKINDTLKCNEWTEFLPPAKRVAPLSQGLAGDIPKTEEEVSEDVRKEQEKESQKAISREELLSLLLADDEDDLEEQSSNQENEKNAEEERKLNEKKELEMKEKELEEELGMSLRKNNTEGK